MRRFAVRRALIGVCSAAALLVLGTGSASAQNFFHGIAFTKGCESPTSIGAPYNCAYSVLNVADTAHDTLTFSAITDQVHSFGGDVNSGNILGALELVFSAPTVSCVGGSGAGTIASPYIGATMCTLPFGTSITTNSHSFYTVQAADFNLPGHTLTDTGAVQWNDLCNVGPGPPTGNCTTGNQTATAGSSSAILQLPSTTATQIHNAAHQVVTTVGTGTTVHDFVAVTGQAGAPPPTGNVSIDWFLNGDCSGNPAANSGPVGPLVPGAPSTFDATAFSFPVNTAGLRAFRAHYLGDPTYAPSDGACEPLQVVDANIQITPLTATNQVGTNHTLTGHVNVNDGLGGGFVNAPDGTVINFSIIGGPGGFVGPTSCTTAGGTGSCTVVITSGATGVTMVRAATDVTVAGVLLHRQTGDGLPGDSADAQKTWVNARISIAPSATNAVGAPHTFTVTLEQDAGNGAGFVPAAGQHVDVTLTDSNGAVHTAPTGTCTNAGPNTNAAGQCTIVFTSNSAGQVTGHATSTLTVGGTSITVSTNGVAPNSGDAVKTFVDANIQITPATAANLVGTNHTLTGHVNVNAGLGAGFVNAPDGTVITFSLANSNGATAVFVGPSSCTTAGGTGSCTVVISSPTTGSTDIKASTTVSVGGVSLTRTTGDGLAGDSADAQKAWVNARISIAPSATNEVRQPHTFTVTLEQDTGTGAFVPAAGQHVDVTLTDSNGAVHTAPTGTCTNAGPNTNAAGQCTITFTSNSAGQVTGHATATLTINGVSITVQTNGVAPNSGDAVKTFVDANIQITPQTATNPVNTNHTLTGHVNVNAGLGAGFVNAPDGTVINFSLANANGATAVFVGPSSCTTAAGTGSCTVVINSPTGGSTNIHASTTVSVGGVSLTRATGDGLPGDSPDAVKNWASARISITPSATNEVGVSHTFTVTLEKDIGGGFVPAAGEHVDVTLTDSNGATHTAPTGTCTTAGANTNAAGQCTITFTSPTAGKVTGHATATLNFNGVMITVSTNGAGGNSADAVKTFVDANIQITPQTATNAVNTNHTLTGHVNVNDGSGGGFVNAPAGTVINFSLTNANGATAVFVGPSNCTTVGATGSCTVVISSPTGGTTNIHASTNVSVGGVSLTRATGDGLPGDSPDAVKNWASARISITPSATNEVGVSHTFTVLLEKDTGGGFVPAAGEHVDVTLTDSNGATHTAPTGTCTNAGANTNAAGQCTITFTSPTPGQVTGHATATLTIGGVSITVSTNGAGGNSGDAVKTFVDANIQITPATAANEVGTNHTLTGHVNVNAGLGAGFVNAPDGTVISFQILNGPGSFVGPSSCTTAGGTGSCTVVITSATPGTTVIRDSTTVSVGGVSLTRASGDGHVGDSADAQKTWVDANIQITPATATNVVNTNHTLTGHVNVNPGTGFVNAPDGTVISFQILAGPGSFVGPSTCTTAGGTGSCTVVITSPTPGTTVIRDSTTVSVGGVSLTRSSGDGHVGDSADAQKIWIAPDANIQISPLQASNAVGTNHTLTGHVNVNPTGAGFVNAPDGTVINFTLTNANGATAAFVGPSSCTTAGGTGSCTIVISSPTPGVTTVKAATDVTVSGVPLHRETGDGLPGDSPNAVKNWVAANIQITPANATNPVGTNHTLTGHVNVNPGTGFVNAPDGTVITFTIANGPGSFVGPSTCTTAGGTGSCTVVITSATTGTTVVNASSTVTVNGVSLTVTTNGAAGNSGSANKNWAEDVVTTHVRDAANADVTNTTVAAGTVVHDEATVARAAGVPAGVPDPTGTVTFTLYNNLTCNGTVVSTEPNVALVGGTANSANFTTPAGGGTFSYLAHYSGDANYPAHDGPCEPFTVQSFAPALSPGYWKNHQAATTALLPITLGNYNVTTFAQVTAIFAAMKCSSPIDCLAAHLLAAKLDVKNGSNPNIAPVIAQADALLIAVNYAGPGNFTPPTAAQRALALQLEALLDAYTNA